MDMTGMAEVKDFEEREEPWPFRVGTQTYYAVPSIGLGTMAEMSSMQVKFAELQTGMAAGTLDVKEIIAVIANLFTQILMPDSVEPFVTRLTDPVKPIGFRTVMGVITWMMECYGLRPTQPSSSSVGESAGDASSSSTPGPASTVVVTGLTDPPLVS